jgi:hypothetical protein
MSMTTMGGGSLGLRPAGRDCRLRTLVCHQRKVGPLAADSFHIPVVALERVVGAHESGRKCMYIQLRSGDNGVPLASESCCVVWIDRG